MAQRNQHIADRIIKSDFVPWKSFKFLQPDGFKELTQDAYEKLRHSIEQNDFVESFKIWESNGNLYCLDGFHRCKVLDILEGEGWHVPEKFRADFVKCKSRKEAKKLVLIYSSIYARVAEEGLYEFAQDLNWDDVVQSIDIPDIDLSVFEQEYFGDTTPEEDTDVGDLIDQAEELNKKWQVKTGDLFELGRHRLLCGDATKQEDVERLMDGQTVDGMICDPPYGMRLDTDYSEMPASKKEIGYAKVSGKKHNPIVGDDKDFDAAKVIIPSGIKEQFWFGADYYAKSLGDTEHSGSWLVWDKRSEESTDAGLGSCFELIWSKQRHRRLILRHKWFGFLIEKGVERTYLHPTEKSTALITTIIENWIKRDVLDMFLGSGTTLIACEKTNRKCFGMEIAATYCAIVLERYYQFTQNKPKRIT